MGGSVRVRTLRVGGLEMRLLEVIVSLVAPIFVHLTPFSEENVVCFSAVLIPRDG